MDQKLPTLYKNLANNAKPSSNLILLEENITERIDEKDLINPNGYYIDENVEKKKIEFRNMVKQTNTKGITVKDKKSYGIRRSNSVKSVVEKKPDFNDLKQNTYDINDWKILIQTLLSFGNLNEMVLSKKLSDFNKLKDLVDFFKNLNCTHYVEKLWAIYLWIASNIEYDTHGYMTRQLGKNDPESVFVEGKCICQGYALLFKYLCEGLNFECIKISGFSKGLGFDLNKPLENTDHAWNAIKIENKWQYVDVTWGSGFTNKNSEYVKKFQAFYFLTPPQIFIYDHYSENYQLQIPRLTLNEFRMLPKFSINFHLYDLECLTHNKVEINAIKNRIEMDFKCPSIITLTANLKDINGNKLEDCVFFARNPYTYNYEFKVSVPVPSKKHMLVFYAKYTSDQSNLYDEVGKFLVICNTNVKFSLRDKYFVKALNAKNIESYLFYPLNLNLKKNTPQKFKVFVRNALKLALVDSDNKWVYFKKDEKKNVWCCEHSFGSAGKVTVFAKMDENKNLDGIFIYNIIE
jgi:hypothetical protein